MDCNALAAIFAFSFFATPVPAQTLPNPSRCVAGSGVTAFPACNYVFSEFSTCSSYAYIGSSLLAASSSSAVSSYASDFYNCYCAQSYLDALFDCDSEERLCLGNGASPDSHLSEEVSRWHKACDTILAYSPTTPVQSSITASYNIDYCNTVNLECQSLTNDREICTSAYQTGGAQLTSCLCQPPLLSLAYDCSILGNVSCLQVPAHLSQMAEYGNCPNLTNVLTIPASVTSSLGTGTTLRFTDYTPTNTSPQTLPTASVTPTATSSSSGNGVGRISAGSSTIRACWLGMVALVITL